MIKLAELLKLREMVYSKKIKPKHQKRMERKLSLFDENLPLPKMDPPTNDSKVTIKELHELAAIKPNVEFVKSGDDVVESFLPLIEKNEVKVSEEILTRLIKESGRFIYKLKYHYNRPRPYQLAGHYNMKLGENVLESMKTPSYPSGHAAQGILIGKVLQTKLPINTNAFIEAGKRISYSRNIGGAHYPSDSVMGENIGHRMYEYIIHKI